MTWIADAGLWTAIVLTGLVAGLLAPQAGKRPTRVEPLLLTAAAAAVVAWCARAGEILSAPYSSDLLTAFVPIDVGPIQRLAVLWATPSGALLTFGTILLVGLAVSDPRSTGRDGDERSRFILTAFVLAASGAAAWFAPRPGLAAAAIPPFAQSPAASLAPLLALAALGCLVWTLVRAMGDGANPIPGLYGAWMASTAAVVAEQVARSRLGIGPRDAILLGSASSGLLLWVLTSALLHRKVRELVQRNHQRQPTAVRHRFVAVAAHVGAGCLVVSFGAHALASRSTVSLPPGVPIEVVDTFRRSWQLVNQGVSRFDAEGAIVTALAVQARSPGGAEDLLTPEIREYHGRDGQHLSSGIVLRKSTGGPLVTLRLLFTEADSLDAARVRVTFLPAPMLWPAGIALLVMASLLSVTSLPNRFRRHDAHAGET